MMGYERDPRTGNFQSDDDGRSGFQDYGSGRDYTYSSARDYQAAGRLGGNDDRGGYGNRDRYGQRDGGGYGGGFRNQGQRGGGYDRGDYGAQAGNRYVEQNRGGRGGYAQQQGGGDDYHGSYASDGRRFEDVGRDRHADDDNYRGNGGQRGGYGRQPQGYDQDDRGFFARAGDEVRSWFGDDEAERRREMDSRYDERHQGNASRGHHDHDYHSWRSGQIAALDRDYDEYRRENQSKFHQEFSSWRTGRQGQRDQLNAVEEHMDVVGSDGEHVGTVDKVRGDRILLTKNDADAGGRHHSIPSSWLQTVDTKVTLNKAAAEAKRAWKDEERNQAFFGDDDRGAGQQKSGDDNAVTQGRTLNRSFSGTY